MATVIVIISILCVLFPLAWYYFRPRLEYLEEEEKYILHYWWGKERRTIIF